MQLEAILVIVALLAAVAIFIRSRTTAAPAPPDEKENNDEAEPAAGPGLRRRAVRRGARGARDPVRAAEPQNEPVAAQPDEDEDELAMPSFDSDGKKIGVKKARSLAMKEQKRREAEAAKRAREDAKERRRAEDEDREAQRQIELEKKKLEEEEEEREREIQRQKEQEEFDAIKNSFMVVEAGEMAADVEEPEKLLEKFVAYIEENKVVLFEDLATEFNLKTQDAVDRIKALEESGRINGVIDDRGKYIYISEEELKEVAKYVERSGRISIDKLINKCSELIRLAPTAASS